MHINLFLLGPRLSVKEHAFSFEHSQAFYSVKQLDFTK